MSEPARWVIAAQSSPAAEALARQLGVPEPIARLLVCRGYSELRAAQAFLQPTLEGLHDPNLMLGMDRAVRRLRAALVAHEPILIYGDYDVDGTIATVLLKTALERAAASLGVTADVRYHIPHRIREGYGMQDERIAAAAEEGVRLVVSVDTGIRAFAAAAEAKRVGLELIVTDHHLPGGAEGVPEALAVLNPNQSGCGYPYKGLCGAGVAFKLAQALQESTAADDGERQRLRAKTLPSFLKLLAIATIADAVPLTGENRVIAAIGLRELRMPAQAGLRALMELADIDTARAIGATDVGFRLAPRINAAGRMDIASDVVEMFLTRDVPRARMLAEKLHRLNDDRRASEAEALRAIEQQLEALAAGERGLPACLVLEDGDAEASAPWHRGVIGILASRVVEKTGRPALVLTHEDGIAYGSGRSVPGFHLLDALSAVDRESVDGEQATPLLNRFGGHAHAVGFSLDSARVAELRERMLRCMESREAASPGDALECDAPLRLGEITAEFLAALEQMGPFGQGNPEPVFVSWGVRVTAAPKVVKERHLRLCIEDPEDDGEGRAWSGMAWSRGTDWAAVAQVEGWSAGRRLDVMFRLRRNWHPEFGGWELEFVALRAARGSGAEEVDEPHSRA